MKFYTEVVLAFFSNQSEDLKYFMEACWINCLAHVACAACIPDASILVSEWGYYLKSMSEVLGNIKTFSRMLKIDKLTNCSRSNTSTGEIKDKRKRMKNRMQND